MNILRIDSSARFADSVTRLLADEVVASLRTQTPNIEITTRELTEHLPLVDESWVQANFTDAAERSEDQRQTLSLSDRLIEELMLADAVVLAVPIYNFGIPAALKAWVDLICRARETFAYTESGPVGLLKDRPVYLVMASGGTPIGGEWDFASGYLRHVLGFVGIHDVRLIAAGALMADETGALQAARQQLSEAVVVVNGSES